MRYLLFFFLCFVSGNALARDFYLECSEVCEGRGGLDGYREISYDSAMCECRDRQYLRVQVGPDYFINPWGVHIYYQDCCYRWYRSHPGWYERHHYYHGHERHWRR